MFDKRDAFCETARVVVRVLCQGGVGRGKAAQTKFVRCENSANCPRNAFCRFVNPLTTRIPLTLDLPVPASSEPVAPPASRPASASTRMPPVVNRPASASTRMPPVVNRPASG